MLVSNAAVLRPGAAHRVRLSDWDESIAVNLTAAMLLARGVLPGMTRQGWGRLVFTTSVAGLTGWPFQTAYASSKAGLLGLTRTIARETARFGVTANAVAPGYVPSAMSSAAWRPGTRGDPRADPDAAGRYARRGGGRGRLPLLRTGFLPDRPGSGGRRRDESVSHALLFPGQGAQFPGMAQRWYEKYGEVRDLFQRSEERTGLPLRTLCFGTSREDQARTDWTQPCVLTASLAGHLALGRFLREHGAPTAPAAVAGHSLGHFTALVAAGVLDGDTALDLVHRRGRIMFAASRSGPEPWRRSSG